MTNWVETTLVLAVALPLALAVATTFNRLKPAVTALLPMAPLPALALALLAPAGSVAVLPDVLLGLRLGVDEETRAFLWFTALLWTLAGFYALTYLERHDRWRARFFALFLTTMAGNLGVVLARDVAGFYLFFSLLSLASYGLVIHDETPLAHYAGRVYITLAVIGETSLLLGFLMATAAAESLLIEDLRRAVATAPDRGLTVGLLVVGFGIKAGLVPLHVWLPLAHPAAPTPASAVLSGVIIKAGILGLLQFLPLGEVALPGWGATLAWGGLFTAYYGVLAGLPQTNAKTVLAYSSLSQMGLVVAGIGVALADPAIAPAAWAAVGLYALHHGLAKGALFLGVGVISATGAARSGLRLLVLAALLMPALAIAGLPLSSGALAKLELKALVGAGSAYQLITLSAIGTTLLMARFLVLAWRHYASEDSHGRPPAGLWLPWALVIGASQAGAWWLFSAQQPAPWSYAINAANLLSTGWPVVAGSVLAALALLPQVARALPRPAVPQGDLVALAGPAGRLSRTVGGALRRSVARLEQPLPRYRYGAMAERFSAWENRLRRWQITGVGFLLVAGLLLVAMAS